MSPMIRTFSAILVATLLAAPAFAQKAAPAAPKQAEPANRELGTFNDWKAYALTEGKTKTCYLLGRPKSSEPKNVKRGDHYLMVTHRPDKKVRNEVNVLFGYELKEKSAVDLQLGQQKFSLFSHEDGAWAPNAETDKAVVDALAKGGSLVVKGTSARGTQTQDTYAMTGFAQAHKAISTACP